MQNLLCELVQAISSCMKLEIANDVKSAAFTQSAKSVERLQELQDMNEWLSHRSELLMVLLRELARSKDKDPITSALSSQTRSGKTE